MLLRSILSTPKGGKNPKDTPTQFQYVFYTYSLKKHQANLLFS